MANKIDMHRYFEEFAPRWTKYRSRRSYYWNSITTYCNYFVHPTDSVLEVGCGAGDLIGRINGSAKVGLDFCSPLIEQAKQRFTGVDFYTMEAENITIDRKFDVIILSNLLGFLGDVEAVFEQIEPLCTPRTRVIVNYYNRLWEPLIGLAELIGLKHRTPMQNWLSDSDVHNLLYLSGFDVYRSNSATLLPIRVPLVSWFCNRILAHMPLMGAFALNKYVLARPLPK